MKMNVMSRDALNTYSRVEIDVGVDSASPHKLISMLFNGAILSVASAKAAMQRNDVASKGQAISRAISIINEGLIISLDEKTGGELAQNLKALYEYMSYRLLEANMKNTIEPLDEVGRLLAELNGAWDVIGKSQPTGAKAVPVTPEQIPNRAAISYGKA
ncbi:flagellar biosynthesis protein FliS [Sulfuricella sp. T08]|uniref:flagellar export chaperone FliS n=1 Tax=Sulfuricella sp. T08 TaxID=1632857 RepID=UPI000617970B|nr:flagellar export chaperone FliS [Sulfuricella sp. T08]GAO35714.1 flagellar biosynthesis protein FliS [Sulfuricella sp. T08]